MSRICGRRRREREESDEPIRVLVLTYNRTLRGYVEELVSQKVDVSRYELVLDTFGHWAWELLGRPEMVNGAARDRKLAQLASGFAYNEEFIADEVDYVLTSEPHTAERWDGLWRGFGYEPRSWETAARSAIF